MLVAVSRILGVVLGEGLVGGHDGVGGGDEDEDGVPEVEEGRQGPKCFTNVCVIGTGLWNRRTCNLSIKKNRFF